MLQDENDCNDGVPEFGHLKYYVEHLEQHHKALMEIGKMTRNTAKQIYLSMVNGGSCSYETAIAAITKVNNKDGVFLIEQLTEFKNQMSAIHDYFTNYDRNLFSAFEEKCHAEGRFHNLKAEFTNILVCDMQSRVLTAMWKSLGNPIEAVLCFDGIMLIMHG